MKDICPPFAETTRTDEQALFEKIARQTLVKEGSLF